MDSVSKPDFNCIQACLRNERKAQFQLYEWCFQELMRVCSRYCKNRDDASALVNTSFLKLLTALPSYSNDKEFIPWMRTIAIRTAVDAHRAKARRMEDFVGDEWPSEHEPDTLNEVISSIELERIEQAIGALDENERVVFNLFEIEGFSHSEIANLLNCSERSSKRYLHRAKENLQNKLSALRPARKAI